MMVLCRAFALAVVCAANEATCAGDACEAEETSLLQKRAMEEASLASGAWNKKTWQAKERELKRGNAARATSNLQLHQRLREHFVHTRKETEAIADRLVALMEKGVLGMWDPADPDAVPDTYIVTLTKDCAKDGSTTAHALKMEEEVNNANDETLLRVFHGAMEGFACRVNGSTSLLRIAEDTCVHSVEQDHVIRLEPEEADVGASSTPDLPWGLDHIDGTADDIYTYVNTGAGTYVYVVDTGIQTSHQEFDDRGLAGADFVNPNEFGNCGGSPVGECASPGEVGCTCGVIPEGTGCSGHGTHCAGTVAGRNVGVAKGAMVVAVRVLSCQGSGYTSGVVAGMDYVVRMKDERHPGAPTVMSMSLGGARPPQSYSDPSRDAKFGAVQAAKALGVTVVVAAGNEAVDADTRSPAHIDDAITVCATNSLDQRASFSCFGPGVDLCAPGVSVNSATTGSDSAYAAYSGTSMATPHVAGVLALILENNGEWTVNQQALELTNDCAEDGAIDMPNGCTTCDPDLISRTPNKLQNLFGKGTQCAAAVADAQAPPDTTTTTTTTLPPGWQFNGNCQVSGGCVQSLGYPNNYGDGHRCTISWNAAGRPRLASVDFQTEAGWDKLTVNDEEYSGTVGPAVGTTVEGDMGWVADSSVTNKGWSLCVEGGPATPPNCS